MNETQYEALLEAHRAEFLLECANQSMSEDEASGCLAAFEQSVLTQVEADLDDEGTRL